ncbi:MAG: glycosyltransferase family 2 protein [Candidatus Sabulitectum sp.]|nr:glycosyltransferase family 2 protein [Candidatus Sabulitectum sp.]
MTVADRTDAPTISAVVPVYNEENNVENAVKTLMGVLANGFSDYEILIIESGSTDLTAEIADRLAASDSHIRVIHQINREGLGSAIRLGFANSTMGYILYIDGDEPFDVGEIGRIIPLLSANDVVIGYRIGERESFKRKLFSSVYNGIIQFFFRLNVRDVNFSMKVVSRHLLKKLKLRANGCFYDAELVAEIRRTGTEICELGFVYTPRTHGESSLDKPSVILNILIEMFEYLLKRKIFGR